MRWGPAAALLVAASAVAASPVIDRAQALFWDQPTREANFRAMETLFAHDTVRRGSRIHPLPTGAPLVPTWTDGTTLDRYLADRRIAGLMVVVDGKVRLERYGLGFGPTQRWTSFSVAKSFTATLVGAALRDGSIHSLDDPVTRYVPGLVGSAYDGVSVRDVLTMTSGVRWNEDYTDPQADVVRLYNAAATPGRSRLVGYLAALPREAAPGTKFVYKTGEADLIGLIVANATGRTLAAYLGAKIWAPYGMAADAYWLKDQADGTDNGGSGVSATLGDYARLGQFILGGGIAGGHAVLADGWTTDAGRRHADIGEPGNGYGYQWWTRDDGAFAGRGVFGQLLHVDPARRLVIVQLAAWPVALDADQRAARAAMVAAVTAAADGEAK